MKTVKIKYFNNSQPINKIEIGDWIDLSSNEDFHYQAGDYFLIPLGVGMILPKNYEANIVPRSSTFKHHGIIQTNHFGVVDESYCGNDDQWLMAVYALKDGKIDKGDRVCQFRINKKMEKLRFRDVLKLKDKNRGGHGSTGR